jgi:hypothetical protein
MKCAIILFDPDNYGLLLSVVPLFKRRFYFAAVLDGSE